ncbi:MAG: glycerophosphodiester phosphodiesterase family protein, partial [Isosphaeraceae bacterium]
EILRYLVIQFHRLLQLGLVQVLIALIMILPGAVVTLLVIELLWAGWDLNTLVILKPAIFWQGVGLGVLINAIAGFFVVRLLLRWSMALPILLFSGQRAGVRQILEESRGLTAAHLNGIARRIVGWFLVQSVITLVTLLVLQKSADGILDVLGFSVVLAIPATILILISHFLVVNLVSIVFNVSFASILIEIYEKLKGPVPVAEARLLQSSPGAGLNRLTFSAIALLGLISGVSALKFNSLDIHDEVEVIAHRAGGALAPENTIAALKNAIRLGCEWAEIDVQLTSDKQIIVAHDTDLRRLAHLNKAVQDCTLAEIQSLDVGSAFSGEFQGEKIPTLEDFLNVAKDKIRIVIELKPHSQQDAAPLARSVVNLLQKRGETKRHRVCSLSYEAVQSVRRDDPSIELGFIVAQAVGPIEKLDADFFMIDEKMATQALVERCRVAGGRFVLAWTVDNPDKVLPLIDNGVRGIITDNPPVIRERYDELRNLSTLSRLVIRVRNEIAD